MKRNFHVPFWRAVEGATLSLTLIKVSPKLIEEGNFDTRLAVGVCDRLSEMERESWEDYRYRKHQLKKEALGLVEDLAGKKSIRVVKRSEKEDNKARERHLKVVENF